MSCHDECETLLTFHSELIEQFPSLESYLATWVKEVHNLQKNSDLESLVSEQKLTALSLGLRKLWLNAVNHHTSQHLKSPPHYATVNTMAGDKFTYPYDRWARPLNFEERYGEKQSSIDDWSQRHLFFTNTMAAVSTLLLYFRNLLPKKTLSLIAHHSYFEFFTLLKIHAGKNVSARFTPNEDKFYGHIAKGDGNVIFIEPVYANNELSVLDLSSFQNAWEKRPNKAETIILIDTTLVGDRFDIKTFLEDFKDNPPAVVASVTSALKLHQIGLEFANLGILSTYIAKQSKYYDDRNKVRKSLRLSRQTLGTGATFEQYSSIDFPVLSKTDFLQSHCQDIFENNASFAKSLQSETGLIKRVVHPTLSDQNETPWAVSPYVIFILKEGTKADIRFLKRVFQKTANKRGLSFQSGSSFGFRFHRFEVNDYHDEKEPSFRIAMGACNGPSVKGITDLVKEVSKYGSFAELRKAYPHIKHPHDTPE